MATNAPAQTPAAPDVLVRGSEEYKEYMRQGGRLSSLVNGLEKRLATSGRVLLLIFIIYATVQGTLLIGGIHVPFWLDVIMLSFQVAGLEGSIPGLTRLREDMLTKRRTEDAREILSSIKSSRLLNLLTGVEIVLGSHPTIGSFSVTDLASWYAGALLLLRLYYITKFLGTMSRMESHGPRIISQAEHDRLQAEREQEQIRLDNVAIQSQIDQALTRWNMEQERKISKWSTDLQATLQATLQANLAGISGEQSRILALLDQPQQAPAIDYQGIIKGVVAQFETRFQEMRQHTFVSQASEAPQLETKNLSHRPVPLPAPRPLRQRTPSQENDPETTITGLLDQNKTYKVRELARLANTSTATAGRIRKDYFGRLGQAVEADDETSEQDQTEVSA